MKTFAIGDIHGRLEALKQCLDRSKFNYKKDRLVVLGDIVDGGYNTYQVVEELLKLKNVIFIAGNHDEFWMSYIQSGWAEEIWLQQGGVNTLKSYGANVIEAEKVSDETVIYTNSLNIPKSHKDFFDRAKYYHIENGMLFVHGGYDIEKGLENTDCHTLVWDRSLINVAKYYEKIGEKFKGFDKIFVAHTTTQLINNSVKPINLSNLWCLDTGAGWDGKLTIMNIDTEEYWQSDLQKPAL